MKPAVCGSGVRVLLIYRMGGRVVGAVGNGEAGQNEVAGFDRAWSGKASAMVAFSGIP